MRSLVINLTRFGDLLQTQPAITALAEQGEVGVVCLANFSRAAELLADVATVHSFPAADLLRLTENTWPLAVGGMREWADDVFREFRPDAVVNLTPSVAGRLLSRYWNDAQSVGMGLDELGFAANSTPWADFLQTASANRGCSPFNVTDLFRYVAGVGAAPAKYALLRPGAGDIRTAMEPLLRAAGDTAPAFVGFQLGASEERRRWPMEHFVELGERLARHDVVPVLLGGPGETVLGERYSSAARHPHVNRIGKTSLSELAALLCGLRLLVTNDTGTMHLAAGLGRPILSIFLCTAQPWDTGPYLPGSLCLEPNIDCHPCAFGMPCARDTACRSTISAQSVACFALHRLEHGTWGDANPHADTVRAWLSRTDDHGFMALAPIAGHAMGDRETWINLQRVFYRQFLDGEEVSLSAEDVARLSVASLDEVRTTLREAQAVAALLGKQALVLSKAPRPALKTKFLAYWQRLCQVLSDSSHFSPLGRLMLSQAQESGGAMEHIIVTLDRYEHFFSGVLREIPE